MSFEPGQFALTASGSIDVAIRLDWESGGPASLSQDETVTGDWIFNNDVLFQDNSISRFIFASTSLGRFGFGDITPEAYFEIASSSGVVASISNIFTINVASGASLSRNLEINVDSSRSFIITDLGGTQETILSVSTIASQSNPGLDIVATTLTAENSAFTISVPASSSTRLPHGVLWVTDTNSLTLASMSNEGTLGLRGSITAHRSVTTCTGVSAPSSGCIDLAENFPTADDTLIAGEVVAIGSSSTDSQNVVRAMPGSVAIGVVSTNPAALITGTSFITGGGTATPVPGYVPVALAGRVPVKVSTENGPIGVGDFLTNSTTKPGVAMKATQAGQTIGQALTPYSGTDDGEVIIFVATGFYGGPGLNVAAGISRGDPAFEATLLAKLTGNRGSKLNGAKSFQEMQLDILAASNEIITPRLFTNEITSEKIKNQPGNDLHIELEKDKNLIVGDSGSPGLTVDSYGNAVFAGQVTADTIDVKHINGLGGITQQLAEISSTVANLSAPRDSLTLDSISITSNFVSLGDFTVSGAAEFKGNVEFESDTKFLAGLTVDGPLSVLGSATFGDITAKKIKAEAIESQTLDDIEKKISILEQKVTLQEEILGVNGGLVVDSLAVFNGGLQVNAIGSVGGTAISLLNDTVFIGRPYFNNDTGGFAIIHKGAKSADVAFEQEYPDQPVVSATIALDNASDSAGLEQVQNSIFENDIRYLVTRKTTKGFTLILNKPAPADVKFNWIALAVKNANIFDSAMVQEPSVPLPTTSTIPSPSESSSPAISPVPDETPHPSESPSPTPEPIPGPAATESPTPVPSPSDIPVPTPEATPEPTPEVTPIPEPTPEPVPEPAPESVPASSVNQTP